METSMSHPETPKTETMTEVIARKSRLAGASGSLALEASMAVNAAPQPGSLDYEVEGLRNPQNAAFYTRAEGFEEVLDQSRSLQETSASLRGSGVTSNPDGTYTLRHEGSSHPVNTEGVPVDGQGPPNQNL